MSEKGVQIHFSDALNITSLKMIACVTEIDLSTACGHEVMKPHKMVCEFAHLPPQVSGEHVHLGLNAQILDYLNNGQTGETIIHDKALEVLSRFPNVRTVILRRYYKHWGLDRCLTYTSQDYQISGDLLDLFKKTALEAFQEGSSKKRKLEEKG